MIGVHVIGSVQPHLEVLSRWKPRACLLLDPSNGAAQAVKAVSPDTFLIGRVYRPDGEVSDRIQANPAEAGRWAAGAVIQVAAGNSEIDVWQVANEVCQTSTTLIQKLNTFCISYTDELARHSLKAAIPGFSVGNPKTPDEDASQWAAFYPAMRHAKARGGVLLLHAYGAKTIYESDDSWLLHRYEKRVIPDLPADLRDAPYVYGEYGCDMGVVGIGQRGWRTGYMGNWNAYAADLERAAHFLKNYPQCRGATVFQMGNNSDWADFDITGDAATKLASIQWPAPVQQPPPGGDMELADVLLAKGEERRALRFNPTAALQVAINRDGFQIASDEFDVSHEGKGYRGQLAERLSDGAVRVYYGDLIGGAWGGNVRHVQRGGEAPQEFSIVAHPSPNFDDRPPGATIKAIVWHATAGGLSGSLSHLSDPDPPGGPDARVSTHYVIAKDGRIFYMVPDEKRAWHAGPTVLVNNYDYNDISVGVELVNQNDGKDPYPQIQLDAAVWLARKLKIRFGMPRSGHKTHAAVAVPPGRKTDPRGLDLERQILDRVYA